MGRRGQWAALCQTLRQGAGARAPPLRAELQSLGSRRRQQRHVRGLTLRNGGVKAVCRGTVRSRGAPGWAPPAAIRLEGRWFVPRLSGWGEVARLWGAHAPGSGRAPGADSSAIPRCEDRGRGGWQLTFRYLEFEVAMGWRRGDDQREGETMLPFSPKSPPTEWSFLAL